MGFSVRFFVVAVVAFVVGWYVPKKLDRYMWLRKLRKGETYPHVRFWGVALFGAWVLKWGLRVHSDGALVGSLCLAFLWLMGRTLAKLSNRVGILEECLRDEPRYSEIKAEHRLAEWIAGAIYYKRITKGMTIGEIIDVARLRPEGIPGVKASWYSDALGHYATLPCMVWPSSKGHERRQFTAYFDNDLGSFQLEFKDGKLVDWDGAHSPEHILSQALEQVLESE